MFKALKTIGVGPNRIIQGDVYELEMIFASLRNTRNAYVELSKPGEEKLYTVSQHNFNTHFVQLD